jgi:hypothetical protein
MLVSYGQQIHVIRRKLMIYDLRTYTLKPRSVPAVLKLFEEAIPTREKYSRLGAFFHTEIGPLNQIVHIWPYEDASEMQRVRGEASADPSGMWPPKGLTPHMAIQSSELIQPAPFMEDWTGPQKLGELYELRIYDLVPGTRGEVLKAWSSKIDGRREYSPLAGCWLSAGVGGLGNKLYHLWAYDNFEHRARVRAETTAAGVWPSDDGSNYLRQENKLLVPASFSPLH